MIKNLLPLYSIVLFIAPMQAQFEWFGYTEIEGDQLELHDKTYTFGYGKLRMDADWSPWDKLRLAGNVCGKKYVGKTEWDLLDFVPYDSIGTMTSYPISVEDTIYVDNLYALLQFERLDITLGRQPISLGTGYAWNPLDIFNQKDLMDPTYEQRGVNALRVEIPIGDRSTVDLILAEHDSIKTGTKMIQLKAGFGSFDVTLNFAKRYHLFPYWRLKDLTTTHTRSDFFGGSFVGQIGDFGFWGEAFLSMDNITGFGEYVFGTDHTFDNGVYIMAEYFRNTLGATEDELSIYRYFQAYSGESKSLMQNYLFAMMMYSFTDFISGSIMAFGNMDDESFSIIPQLEWNVLENMMVSVFVGKSFGSKNTEFGIQDKMARIRLRAYF